MFLCTLIIFKTCRLMYSTLSTLFRVDNFVNWLVFFLFHVFVYGEKQNGFPLFLRFRILILLLVFYFSRFFFQTKFYLFNGYLSKLYLYWLDRTMKEKPCSTFRHGFSRLKHQPEDNEIRINIFVCVSTFL